MKLDIPVENIISLVERQLFNIFSCTNTISPYMERTLVRLELCFNKTKNKYYHDNNGDSVFSPFHSGQYSIFLYYLSNTIFRAGDNDPLATKIYYLNKVLHSIDWYYEIELPSYWGVEHPLGTILGRAEYSNGLFLYQGCTIGGNNGLYPKLGENVIMYSNSSILGNSIIGNNVVLSTHAVVLNQNIQSNSIVYGISPNLTIVEKPPEYIINKYINQIFS